MCNSKQNLLAKLCGRRGGSAMSGVTGGTQRHSAAPLGPGRGPGGEGHPGPKVWRAKFASSRRGCGSPSRQRRAGERCPGHPPGTGGISSAPAPPSTPRDYGHGRPGAGRGSRRVRGEGSGAGSGPGVAEPPLRHRAPHTEQLSAPAHPPLPSSHSGNREFVARLQNKKKWAGILPVRSVAVE